jgi:nitroimidazol reductase NimA-like FMN-containing flavoprotein (pyridoxamine 5'-phosphate oxidase superfamily)
MSIDPSLTHIRRHDRAVEDQAWIAAFLQRAPFGVLAMSVDDQPFVNTNNFAYDPARHAIYFHHADDGRTLHTLTQNPRVCFTAAQMGRLLPAPQSRGFGVEYASVVAYGQARRVLEASEMLHGLGLLMAKYAPHLHPGQDYRTLDEGELKGVAVFRIDIEAWTAKRKTAPENFPGAYRFPEQP